MKTEKNQGNYGYFDRNRSKKSGKKRPGGGDGKADFPGTRGVQKGSKGKKASSCKLVVNRKRKVVPRPEPGKKGEEILGGKKLKKGFHWRGWVWGLSGKTKKRRIVKRAARMVGKRGMIDSLSPSGEPFHRGGAEETKVKKKAGGGGRKRSKGLE